MSTLLGRAKLGALFTVFGLLAVGIAMGWLALGVLVVGWFS